MQTSVSILLLLWFCSYRLSAQNLLANPGFEDANVCTEFLARCAPEAWKEVNYGRMVYIQNSKGGKTGFMLTNVRQMRTYLFTELLCPLEAGERYDISFDLNLRGATFKPFGIYLSTENLSGKFDSKTVEPMITFTEKNCSKKMKKMDWVPFKGTFTANGGERFFYLGYYEPVDSGYKGNDWIEVFFVDNFRLVPQNKSITLCPEAAQKRAELYADNWRHMGFPTDTVAVKDSIPAPNMDIFDDPAQEADETPPPPEMPRQPDTLILAGICFDFDKSTLNSYYAAVTDSLTDQIVSKNPEKVLISGHTDNIGTDEFNRKLSLARALTVEQILIGKGLGAEKISCVGEGETRPVAANDTESGRAANRRIEVVLFFKD